MQIRAGEITRHYHTVLGREPLPAETLYWRLYPGCDSSQLRYELAGGREFETLVFQLCRELLLEMPCAAGLEACRALVVKGSSLADAVVRTMNRKNLNPARTDRV